MRTNQVSAIIGTRNTGKTVFCKEVIQAYKNQHPGQKILIVDTLDHPSYNLIAAIDTDQLKRWKRPAVYRIFGNLEKMSEILSIIDKDLKNALIIYEDASKYINKIMQGEIRRLIFDSKQKNIDIIFIFHGFVSMPPELFRQMDALTIFKTGDSPASRKNDMVNYTEIEAAHAAVMKDKNRYAHKTIRIY